MQAFKEKVEDKFFKQDQFLQIVHMLCEPKPYYDEHRNVAIGYKSPLCLARAKQVQPALYNSHEIIKTDHVPAILHNLEDTLEIAEITRKKMNEKIKTLLWTHHKINIRPPEVVATACYTQNRSLIHTRHNKTPYELVHNKKPDLTLLHVFGALCYPINDSEDLGKLQPTTDTVTTEDMQKRRNDVKARTTLLLALPDEHQLRFSKYKTTQELWAAILKTFGGNEATKKTKKNQLKQQWKPTGRIFKIDGLRWIPTGKMFTGCTTKVDSEPPNGLNDDITNPYECDQTLNKDYEVMFQSLFDEYFNPLPRAVSPDLAAVAAPRAIDQSGLPSSTTIDQDVPSANPSSEESTLQGFIPSNLHHLNQSFDTLTKLTKNHSLENVIGDPS
uniref:Retrovirus-related Pol polyprotein from transposon TNT 1-94 n=1 Tax=Tanacetum cinerariifolium TaxID=118510 RepID=A0A699H1M8_TANCI|nr:retrovirus-related Pol polyprotein from transposon TNT 1-94 [Tanacetum cinerariifolium]